MSIRPVDTQLVMPRAMESSRTAAAESTRPFSEQNQFAQQLQKNINHEQQSVNLMNKSEGQNVDKDGKNNNGGKQNRRERRVDRRGTLDRTDENGVKKPRGSLLDISL